MNIEEIEKNIERYELMLDRNENDCEDKERISTILEELYELKDKYKSV